MRRALRVAACLALAAAMPAACGGDDDQAASSVPPARTGPAEPTGTSTTPVRSGVGVVSVTMKDIEFRPMQVSVKVGQTIRWTNQDAVAHTVTAQSGAKFDSGTINIAGNFSYKPTRAGEIQYICTIHPNQKGSIEVTG